MVKNKKKKIFYWSPCLNPVGTIKSTINSIASVQKYGDKNFEAYLINACGEWDRYLGLLNLNNVKIINFNLNFFKYLPKEGYFKSRLSYLIIYIFCFFPLMRSLIKEKPDFLIAHLITSLPLTIMKLFNFKTKFILRISGMPKLNFLRKYFWKFVSSKISKVTCPSLELKLKLKNINLFDYQKLQFLPDAILDIKNFSNQKKEIPKDIKNFQNRKIIIAAGRLTRQKNFSYLINEFASFCKKNDDYNLLILGEGEKRSELENIIIQNNLNERVFLIGYRNNVYQYFKKAEIFILSSLWEEVGFVMVEAAISNLFVISSNCPNGPTELLDKGNNGILFDSNKKKALEDALLNYHNLKDIKKFRVNLKKNIIRYTKFRHFLVLKKILIDF